MTIKNTLISSAIAASFILIPTASISAFDGHEEHKDKAEKMMKKEKSKGKEHAKKMKAKCKELKGDKKAACMKKLKKKMKKKMKDKAKDDH